MLKPDTSFQDALVNVNLTPLQRSILEKRYVELVKQFSRRCTLLSVYFHTSRIVVTVGSLIVPALLSIQYTDASPASQATYSMSYQIYWVTWVISLLVTTFNGIQSIFKLEKKYFSMHTSMELLRSEGWQYIELSGHYSGFYTPNEAPSHENQFKYFCAAIEKIKMKQVEEEYWKINETQQEASKETGKKNALIPPTPYKPLQTTIDIHPEMSVKVIETVQEQNNSSAENKNEPEGKQQDPKKSMSMPIVLSETTDAQ